MVRGTDQCQAAAERASQRWWSYKHRQRVTIAQCTADMLQADNVPGQLPGRQIDDYLSMLSDSNVAPDDDDATGLSDAKTSMQSISLI